MRRPRAIVVVVVALLIAAASALIFRSGSTDTAQSINDGASPARIPVRSSSLLRARAALDRRRIAGRTIDAEGNAIARVLVCASHVELAGATCVETDEAGAFAIDPLLAARHTLRASTPGWVLEGDRHELIIDVRTASRDDVKLTLMRSERVVRGNVRDGGGGPIAGARVFDARASVYSDSDGAYALTARFAKTHLSVEADGYAPAERYSNAPARGIDFELVPAASVRGIVVEEGSSRPIAGAIVEATKLDEFTVRRAVSDGDRRFVIDALDQGRHRLSAHTQTLLGESRASIFVEAGIAPPEIRIEVRPAFRVSGHALYEGTDDPCPVGAAWISGRDRTTFKHIEIRNGEVDLGLVPPGVYDLAVVCGAGGAVNRRPSCASIGTSRTRSGACPDDSRCMVSSSTEAISPWR